MNGNLLGTQDRLGSATEGLKPNASTELAADLMSGDVTTPRRAQQAFLVPGCDAG
jgi:hypothetical protein